MIELLTALPGAPWEGELVARVERAPAVGVRVVRRCADLADLLAVAASGTGSAALVSADLRRLDRDALARLGAAGVAVIGVAAPTDAYGREQLERLGVAPVLASDTSAEDLADAVAEAVERVRSGAGGTAYAEPLRSLATGAPARAEPEPDPTTRAATGRMVAVWGPAGAPGRTTVAVALASETAALGRRTLLVDADTYGGVVAPLLGLLDEAAGLAAVARLAVGGGLDLAALARTAPEIEPGLRLLSGIPRPDRWPELRPAALEEVYALARRLADVTVVDCGFCLERDEELSFDVAAPRRNGATLATLEQADEVVAVCAGDPLSVQRFVRGLRDLREVVPDAPVRVVVNRVRRGAVGARPEQQLAESLRRYAGVTDAVFVPDDRAALDAALVAGRTLREVAPGSPVRTPVRALAAELAGVPLPRGRRLTRRRAATAPRPCSTP